MERQVNKLSDNIGAELVLMADDIVSVYCEGKDL
jgi:hypothetical protein